ncbi:MAG: MMPL family transporter [Gammaproteobacteria bacterium]
MADWKLTFVLDGQILDSVNVPEALLAAEEGITLGRATSKMAPGAVGIPHAGVSRGHAKLHLLPGGMLILSDQGSSNGTFVNDSRLEPDNAYHIKPGDSVRVSKVEIRIDFPDGRQQHVRGAVEDLEDRTYVVENEVHTEGAVVDETELEEEKAAVTAEGEAVPPPSERFIEAALTFGARQPLISLILIILLSGLALWGALHLKIDTSYDSLFSKEDPDYIPYTGVVGEFGSDNMTLIYLRDANLWRPELLAKIEDLTFTLQDLEFVEKSESLFTALHIRDDEGSLDLRPLMDYTPETAEEIAEIRGNALYSPLMNRNILSGDGNVTALTVSTIGGEGDPEHTHMVYEQFAALLAPLEEHFDQVFQVGPPRLNVDIEQGMFSDLSLISPLATLVLVVSIVMFLRTGVAALLPLTTAGISIFWTMGFMGAAGIPVNLLTAILPALVIVIGSTEDTHMLSAYLDGLDKDKPNRLNAIRFMAVHVGLPIFITSFTTTVGFISNAVSDIALIRDFGLASSFAMVSNLVATLLVLPLLLRYLGPRVSKQGGSHGAGADGGRYEGLLRFIEGASGRHELKVIVATVLVVGVCAWASTKVQVSNDPLSYFKSGSPITEDADTLHRDLSGMQLFYVTLTAPEGRDFKDPELLAQVQDLHRRMETMGRFDKVTSIVSHLSLVHQEMNGSNPEFFHVPESRGLTEQYLFLFQRKDIDRYLSPDARRVNYLIRHNLSDSWALNTELDRVRAAAREALGPDVDVFLSGKNLLINRAAETLFTSQVMGLALLIGIIFIIMSLLFGSMMAGVLSLVPNLIPIAILFGTMGLLGIPLNPGTAIVAVIAVGIAIDDTIHLLSRYNALCRTNPDQDWATRTAVRDEAVPVISTSLSLAAGFGVLYFSGFEIVAQFGTLSALTMLTAMVTDLLITPILLKRIRLVGIWDVVTIKIRSEDVLLRSPVFAGMTRFQIRKAILLSEIREFAPGQVLFNEGDSGSDMYLVLSGTAEILKRVERRKKLIARVECGNVFGERGYLGASERAATVRASKDAPMQVLVMNAKKVRKAMRFYPWTSLKLQKNVNAILGHWL